MNRSREKNEKINFFSIEIEKSKIKQWVQNNKSSSYSVEKHLRAKRIIDRQTFSEQENEGEIIDLL